jgi:hypothetical protein
MKRSNLFKVKEFIDSLMYPIYILRGRLPWSLGYYTAKKNAICNSIDSCAFNNGCQLSQGYGYRIDERVVEYPWLFSNLPNTFENMLDAGSALNYDFLLDRLSLRANQLTIMTLAPEKRCFWYMGISYLFGDLRNTNLKSQSFDVVASISTIEHIGLDNTLYYTSDLLKKENDVLGFIPAIYEFKRLLRKGGICLITVPYGMREINKWYQVFDKDLLAKAIAAFEPNEYSIEYFKYEHHGWKRCNEIDIQDAKFFDIHQHKKLCSDYAAGSRGLACIRLIA